MCILGFIAGGTASIPWSLSNYRLTPTSKEIYVPLAMFLVLYPQLVREMFTLLGQEKMGGRAGTLRLCRLQYPPQRSPCRASKQAPLKTELQGNIRQKGRESSQHKRPCDHGDIDTCTHTHTSHVLSVLLYKQHIMKFCLC